MLVVAGGSGNRFGGLKQFATVHGETVIERSVRVAREHADGVVVVLPESQVHRSVHGADAVVAGGVTRSDSVRAGVAALPGDAAVVLVHDAARPLASADLFRRVIDAVRAGADAVVPAVDVIDSLRARAGGVVERSELVAVQTPQGFSVEALRAAHAAGVDATDDASLAERCGFEVVIVEGEPTNLKITHPHDLAVAEALLEVRDELGGSVRMGL